MALPDRFWRKVDKSGECWLWTGAGTRPTDAGYGFFSTGTRLELAHRLAWADRFGPVPPGLELDHLCRTRACVNPDHLEPVTHRENTLRSPVAPAAINARKTHCPRGHEYAGTNLLRSGGRRFCRTCLNAHTRRYRAAKRVERAA